MIDISKKLSLTLVDEICKPLDENRIDAISKTHTHIITLEDNVITGGAGSAVNEYLIQEGTK